MPKRLVARQERFGANGMKETEQARLLENEQQDALDALSCWLQYQGLHGDRAIRIRESIRDFYVNELLSRLPNEPSCAVGLAGCRSDVGLHELYVHVLWHEPIDPESLEQNALMNDLTISFVEAIAFPLLPTPLARLEFLSPPSPSPNSSDALVQFCDKNGLEFLGQLPSASVLARDAL